MNARGNAAHAGGRLRGWRSMVQAPVHNGCVLAHRLNDHGMSIYILSIICPLNGIDYFHAINMFINRCTGVVSSAGNCLFVSMFRLCVRKLLFLVIV